MTLKLVSHRRRICTIISRLRKRQKREPLRHTMRTCCLHHQVSEATRRSQLFIANILLEHRIWTTLHFFAFYLTTTFSPGSYNLGATLVSIGLLYWHAMIAAVIGSIILTVVLVFNSRGATKYHIGFPAFIRVSAGLVGSRLFILVRAIVACLYFSIQTYYA